MGTERVLVWERERELETEWEPGLGADGETDEFRRGEEGREQSGRHTPCAVLGGAEQVGALHRCRFGPRGLT